MAEVILLERHRGQSFPVVTPITYQIITPKSAVRIISVLKLNRRDGRIRRIRPRIAEGPMSVYKMPI